MRGRPSLVVVSLVNAPRLVRVSLPFSIPHLDLAAVGRFEVVDELVEARALVPDVEERQRGVVPHPVAVGVDRRRYGGVGPAGLHPVLASRHDQAGGEARHVPLEGPGKGLVEVAQVEVEVALGGGPQPEVQDVRVPAELHLDPAVRLGGQVGRHDGRRPPVEVPRRERHALVPERGELGQPDVVLGEDRVDGVVAAGTLVPLTDGGPGREHPRLSPHLAALEARGGEIVLRRHRRGRSVGTAHGIRPLSSSARPLSLPRSAPVRPCGPRRRHSLRCRDVCRHGLRSPSTPGVPSVARSFALTGMPPSEETRGTVEGRRDEGWGSRWDQLPQSRTTTGDVVCCEALPYPNCLPKSVVRQRSGAMRKTTLSAASCAVAAR